MRINLLCSDRHLPSDVLATLKQDHWGIDRVHLFLSIILLIQFFSWRFRFSFREERLQLKHELNIKPVKAEKDDTDLALGVEKL